MWCCQVEPGLSFPLQSPENEFSVTIGDTGEVVSFEFTDTGLRLGQRHCDTHFEMSSRIFTSIVFDAHPEQSVEVPDELRELFPFYFPIWELDHS